MLLHVDIYTYTDTTRQKVKKTRVKCIEIKVDNTTASEKKIIGLNDYKYSTILLFALIDLWDIWHGLCFNLSPVSFYLTGAHHIWQYNATVKS